MAGPGFPTSETSDQQTISVANTNWDGTTGTYATLATGTSSGRKKVYMVKFNSTVTTATGADIIKLFKKNGSRAQFAGFAIVQPSGAPGVGPPPTVAPHGLCYIIGGKVELPTTSDTLIASTHAGITYELTAEGEVYA
jgi:hypothetical protein